MWSRHPRKYTWLILSTASKCSLGPSWFGNEEAPMEEDALPAPNSKTAKPESCILSSMLQQYSGEQVIRAEMYIQINLLILVLSLEAEEPHG